MESDLLLRNFINLCLWQFVESSIWILRLDSNRRSFRSARSTSWFMKNCEISDSVIESSDLLLGREARTSNGCAAWKSCVLSHNFEIPIKFTLFTFQRLLIFLFFAFFETSQECFQWENFKIILPRLVLNMRKIKQTECFSLLLKIWERRADFV